MANETEGTKIEAFGRDHWSTFAYIETRIVDHEGKPNFCHMRCDLNRHPFFGHEGSRGACPPTRLRGIEIVRNHDDWDCLEDCEREGLLENVGTGVNPVYRLTEKGSVIAGLLRRHKARDGQFSDFMWTP